MSLSIAEQEARRDSIGASEAAAVLGVSRWRKAIDVWAEKVGHTELVEREDNPWQAWGRIAEPMLVRWTAETLPARIRRNTRSRRHPKYRFISATPDGIGSAIVEAKTSRSRDGYGEEGSDEIPIDYKVQAVVQAEIFDAPKVYVPVLFSGLGWPPALFVVQPSRKERAAVLDALVEFWRDHVETGIEPPELSDAYVRARWKIEEPGKEIVATDEVVALVEKYRLAVQNKKAAEEAADELGTIIRHRMGDAEKLIHPYGAITWKTGRPRTDWKLVAKAYRELIESLTDPEGPYRVHSDVDLDALESLHTAPEGSRIFRPTWKEGDSE